MASSGSTNWTVTRDDIIKAALRTIGAVASGETPSANDISEGSEALNGLIKGWQARGIGLWLIDTSSITLVADQQSYTMGPSGADVAITRPLDIVEARFYNATARTETPMEPTSRKEYFDLPDKASTGTPTQYYYDPILTSGRFYIWPVWDDTTSDTIRFSYKTEVEDFDAAANNPDFPKEWFRALKFNLALDLAPEYGKEPGRNLLVKAAESLADSDSWDRDRTGVQFELERR